MSTTPSSSFFSDEFNEAELEQFDHVGGKRLHILNQVGKTQRAAVFHAMDRHADREVAIKVIECKATENNEWRKVGSRIRREVKAWVEVENRSPYILPLNDVLCHRVTTPDQQFIAFVFIMPFAPLGDLRKYIKENAPNGLDISVRRLRTFLLQIADALEAVHASGSVHKDIKASNILLFPGRVESDGKQGLLPKLADFGITQKILDDSHGVEGTPEYMAPESFGGADTEQYRADFPSDIYSLGLLFYEIITGSLPYRSPVLSPTEKFAAYQALHKSGRINLNGVRSKMGEEMETLIKDMLNLEPNERPRIGEILAEINKQIIIAEHGEITAEGTRSAPVSTYRWNPFVHERLGDQLCYYFLKGQNSKNDPLWICETLLKNGVHGYSLYRVIGGIDLLLRIWERPGITAPTVESIMSDFKRLQNGQVMHFKVEGFHAISSKPAISFSRFDKADVNKLVFENLKENREDEFQALSDAGLATGRFGYDATKESHPLRFFVAFRINDMGSATNKRIFAREIYEMLLPFQKDGQVAGISVYWGSEAYSFLLKVRLKRFEDYETIWNECFKAFYSVHEGIIVQPDTYLELQRLSIRESDDGNIWKDVDKYRVDHRLNWPNRGLR